MNGPSRVGVANEPLPAIAAERLTFRYDGRPEPVFRDLTFSVRKGETVLFLGPSGCGKSTLLLCLNRLYPDAVDGKLEGTVRVSGRPLSEFAPGEACRQVGIVFQDPDSQFCMTRVDEEVAFGLENLKIPRADMDERIERALRQVGLADCRKERIHTLSGGMRQRLAVACALAAEPDILLLDEPTAQLDAASARDLVRLLIRLQRERGLTLLLVEHRLDEWIEAVDRVYLMSAEGRFLGEGSPRSCFSEHGEALSAQGIWIPTVSRMALDLKASGAIKADPLPVSEAQFLEAVAEPEQAAALLQRREGPPRHAAQSPRAATAASAAPVSEGSVLSVSGLTVQYGHQTVLRGIDLEFPPGELTAIIGTNGSGKSTLLQHLAGIGSKKASGAVQLNGRLLADWPGDELRRLIGFVFQNPEHQFVTFTVYEEIAFSLRLRRVPEAAIKTEAARLLEESGLAGLEQANPFSLSQGQKRRLSVATMLADEQMWLLLDEPTFGQDARTSAQLLTLLRDRVDQGKAVIMVSHDMEAVERYADRVILLVDGRVRYDGKPAELWEQTGLLAEGGIVAPVSHRLRTQLETRLGKERIRDAIGAGKSGR